MPLPASARTIVPWMVGSPKRSVLRKVRVGLRGEIAPLADEPGRLDVEAAAGGMNTEHAGAERLAFGMEAKRPFHRRDAVRQRELELDVAAGKDEHGVGHLFAVVA